MILGKLYLFAAVNIFFCIADFVVNSIFEPTFVHTTFQAIIFVMFQILTFLCHFFSWFFLVTSTKEAKYEGYERIAKKYFFVFLTSVLYIILFAISKIVLISRIYKEEDLADLWDNWGVITTWTLQRITACVLYGLGLTVIIRSATNPIQFIDEDSIR